MARDRQRGRDGEGDVGRLRREGEGEGLEGGEEESESGGSGENASLLYERTDQETPGLPLMMLYSRLARSLVPTLVLV